MPDFSGIQKEMQKTQKQIGAFQSSLNSSMGAISKAFKIGLGYISVKAITGFVKATTEIASDLTEVQNVVDVTFGSMAKDINEFSKTALEQFGLSELSAKKYTSTMGAMLKSSGITGEAVKDMSIEMAKLSADMASFYNLPIEEAFSKIRSGISGETEPLKQLGINMRVANLEAYAMSQGIKKSWKEMTQAEQTMIRYKYLLSVTGDAQGDFARNSHTWANQTKILAEQWNSLKGTIGQGFINMLMPVIKGFNALIKKIQVAAEYFKAFTRLIFGDAQASSQSGQAIETMADNLSDVEDGFGGVGEAGKKAAKDLKGALAGFDEINTLAKQTSDGTSELSDGLGGIGGVVAVDLGAASSGELDISTSKIESNLTKVNSLLSDLYNNWGTKDFFKGFRDGLDLINFDSINTNLSTFFNGMKEIAKSFLTNLQPVFQSAGHTLGTLFKNGIAIAGNLFEPISLGWANFTINMKGRIQEWIAETSQTVSSGFNNLTEAFEILGQSWLDSIEKYKPNIAKAVEETTANVANTFMQIGTIAADTFEIITSKAKEYYEDNEEDIQRYADSILGIFTDVWDLINKIWTDALGSIKKFWNTWGKDIVSGVMDFANDIGKWFLYLWNDLVKPTWDTMMEWLNKIWNENLKGLVDELLGFVGRVGDLILKLWNDTFKPLIDRILKDFVPAFKNAFNFVVDIVGNVVNTITGLIKELIKVINGIIDFVVGVFTGDWKRAWEGVKGIFSGIIGSLETVFKGAINGIIAIANSFIHFWNRIELKVPEIEIPLVGKVGGFRLGLPEIKEIPKLKTGAITDVNSPFYAVVGDHPTQREVISPLNDLLGMIETTVNRAVGNNQGGDMTVIVKIGEDTITEKLVRNINRQSRISGKTVVLV